MQASIAVRTSARRSGAAQRHRESSAPLRLAARQLLPDQNGVQDLGGEAMQHQTVARAQRGQRDQRVLVVDQRELLGRGQDRGRIDPIVSSSCSEFGRARSRCPSRAAGTVA